MSFKAVSTDPTKLTKVEVDRLVQSITRPDITFEELEKGYTEWVKDGGYDAYLSEGFYLGPQKTVEAVKEQFSNVKDKSTVKILDVGAGTGLIAKILIKEGFTNLDALDPVQAMLDSAKEQKLYKHYFCEKMGDKPTTLPQNTYDAVVTCGTMTHGHMPSSAIREMVRVTRPGGFVIIIMNAEKVHTVEEYAKNFDPLMKQLEEENAMEILKEELFPNYIFNIDGLCWLLKVLK